MSVVAKSTGASRVVQAPLRLFKNSYRVADFIQWMRAGTLRLNPNFQRRNVWQPSAKSYLIDTILRGMPIPIIFLREVPSSLETLLPLREVVDGQQRLRTVLSFASAEALPDFDPTRDDFRLRKVHQPDYPGARFNDLPAELRQRILDYEFSVHALPSTTGDDEVLQIFARMNSTGMKVNPQELRNAKFFGEFKTVAYRLAHEHLQLWREWPLFSEQALARMDEVEFTSELMMLSLDGVMQKSDKTIDRYYEDFDEEFPRSDEVMFRVRFILDVAAKRFTVENRELFNGRFAFYALFTAIHSLAFGPAGESRRATAKRILSSELAQILKGASSIKDLSAPRAVLELFKGQLDRAENRKHLAEYLLGRGGEDVA